MPFLAKVGTAPHNVRFSEKVAFCFRLKLLKKRSDDVVHSKAGECG